MVVRVLIDQGSTVSFIAEKTVQALRLKRSKENMNVSGVGGTTNSKIKGSTVFSLKPHFPSLFSCEIKAYILQQITCIIPTKRVEGIPLTRFSKLQLADPLFNEPNVIDVLLGADILSIIMRKGIICGQPLAQETQLGWVISGKVGNLESLTGWGVCMTADLEQSVQNSGE